MSEEIDVSFKKSKMIEFAREWTDAVYAYKFRRGKLDGDQHHDLGVIVDFIEAFYAEAQKPQKPQ